MKAPVSLRLRPSRAEFSVFLPYSDEDVRDTLLSTIVRYEKAARAGSQRFISLNMLRHLYAAHLVEADTDIRLLQDLLSHASIKSTGIYIQRTKRPPIAPPLDDWG